MQNRKCGKQSFTFANPPVITAWASIAGKKESEGPLSAYFDAVETDSYFGQKTWEQAEKNMQQRALELLSKKSAVPINDIDMVCSGDLLNQCIGSAFTLRNMGIPHLGLYGACSTMAESILMAAMAVGGGFFERVVAMTSSHFASSERQYRFPLGYGGQRTPTAQWTVTGSGAAMICPRGKGPKITACTIGTITDMGIKDANNMGAAMAPAVCDTLRTYFEESGESAADFDLIITGDLGTEGSAILEVLCRDVGFSLEGRHFDCGANLYDLQKQDAHAGASGCGCIASMLASCFVPKLARGEYRRLLVMATGALMSPSSVQQGGSIIGIAPAAVFEYEKRSKK